MPVYPFILNTGRTLEHWHTGSMTRRSRALSTIKPRAFAKVNPADLARLGIANGELVRVSSRRGKIELQALADPSVEVGNIFIPFHFREAAANVLTNDALDLTSTSLTLRTHWSTPCASAWSGPTASPPPRPAR